MSATGRQSPKWKKVGRACSWLGTIAVLLFYIPLAAGTAEACKKLSSSTIFDPQVRDGLYLGLLTPPLLALCTALMMLYIGCFKSSRHGAQMLWALMLLGAMIGWPVSCASSAMLNERGTWMSH
jgi:hypothetical protein